MEIKTRQRHRLKKRSIAALLSNATRLRILITVPLRYFSRDQGEIIKVKGMFSEVN